MNKKGSGMKNILLKKNLSQGNASALSRKCFVMYIYYAIDRSAVYDILIVHFSKCTIKMLRICNILIVHTSGGNVQ